MLYETIVSLILSIAVEVGVPPLFALAIAMEENPLLNPLAISEVNKNGTVDLGIMQLNSEYYGHIMWHDPGVNVRAGCRHIKDLMNMKEMVTFWCVAVCYNAGAQWLIKNEKPPDAALDYAERVMSRWVDLSNGDIEVLINRR
jgi:soluble lytic murein transglycosylase-like protein